MNHLPTVTRRDFVKTAGAAVAVPTIAGLASAASFRPHTAGSDTIKVALIGCGGRGTGAAYQALCADKGVVLWAMSDAFEDRLKSSYDKLNESIAEAQKDKTARAPTPEQIQVAPERKFVGLDSYQKAIDSGVDVVLLTSYPAFRPAHLKAAVAAGKHIFAEKPLAVDSPGIRSVLESAAQAKKKNLALMVGFCWRYNDGMKTVFEKILGGAIGDVVNVHTNYLTGTLGKNPRQPQWSDLEFQLRNWWHFTWISGDHIVEQAIHSIDRLAWAVGDRMPKQVTCLGGRAARVGPESGNAYDHFAPVYEYEGGMRCTHACRQIGGCPSDNSDYVYGTKGSAIVNGWTPVYSIKDHAGKKIWDYDGPAGTDTMYQNEHDDFYKALRSGAPINDCERGARSCMMAIMARMAAYTGQTITWDQAMKSTESLVPEKLEFGPPFPTPAVAIPGQTKFA